MVPKHAPMHTDRKCWSGKGKSWHKDLETENVLGLSPDPSATKCNQEVLRRRKVLHFTDCFYLEGFLFVFGFVLASMCVTTHVWCG